MSKWEYRVVKSDSDKAQTALAPLGLEGWELVGLQFGGGYGSVVLYLKRPLRG